MDLLPGITLHYAILIAVLLFVTYFWRWNAVHFIAWFVLGVAGHKYILTFKDTHTGTGVGQYTPLQEEYASNGTYISVRPDESADGYTPSRTAEKVSEPSPPLPPLPSRPLPPLPAVDPVAEPLPSSGVYAEIAA